ncbi:FAD:protein FMN transferase [Halodesulfovibrio marinisediminis]|uniref:FAD:protein FMN transferase n=1 Tax=Halodesulfovibrio marinisediminis DSM 17456 TaxID=1121457 RepID=A0A1N6F5B9_9BACT|nr:FAD:protein FMN transferase [Halodesulfovibrio marinisediminis]SIN90394.1 thiamine biosynthesis lipoprotein [Halodesulfovibrio marinisediminis DSM 17456]
MTTSRRQFLQACGVLGLGAAVTGVPAVASAARVGNEYKVQETRFMMGTVVTITALHPSKQLGEEAIGRSFEEITRLEALLSRYRSDSPVSVLNRDGRLSGIPQELADVVRNARLISKLSDKAFDVTIKPVVDLYKEKANRNGKMELSKAEFEEALSLVDADSLVQKRDSIRLNREGMGITLDGIAKGYIVDKASAVLAAYGAKNHMINAGGDIRTMGEKVGSKPWVVAVQDPEKKGNYPAVIQMTTGALATSGGYEVFYDKHHMYHHLVSPQSGMSPNNVASVSILAPSVMEADALATAAFIMQSRRGLQFVEALNGREALFVTKNGMKLSTTYFG